jgi:hypothetical protein
MATFSTSSIKHFDCGITEENLGVKWAAWVRHVELYFSAAKVTDEAQKLSTMLFLAGQEVVKLSDTLSDVEVDATTYNTEYKKVKQRLTVHFSPSKNVTRERFNFYQARQEHNETISQYVVRLKILAEFCEFEGLREPLIASHVVTSCLSDKFRRECLLVANLTLKDVIESGRCHDTVEVDARVLEGKVEIKEESINQIGRERDQRKSIERPAMRCFSCGRGYPHVNVCPAVGKRCNKCGEMNHFEVCCKQDNGQKPRGSDESKQYGSVNHISSYDLDDKSYARYHNKDDFEIF